MAFYSYDGLRDGGTFKLNATTASTIKSAPQSIIGKVVTVTGSYEVGYGRDGDLPLGIVESVEPEASGRAQTVVGVAWHKMVEGVPCTSGDAAGNTVTCDGKGGVKKKADNAYTGCKIIGIDSATVATVKFE